MTSTNHESRKERIVRLFPNFIFKVTKDGVLFFNSYPLDIDREILEESISIKDLLIDRYDYFAEKVYSTQEHVSSWLRSVNLYIFATRYHITGSSISK